MERWNDYWKLVANAEEELMANVFNVYNLFYCILSQRRSFPIHYPGEIIACISFERFMELIIVAFMADCFV